MNVDPAQYRELNDYAESLITLFAQPPAKEKNPTVDTPSSTQSATLTQQLRSSLIQRRSNEDELITPTSTDETEDETKAETETESNDKPPHTPEPF